MGIEYGHDGRHWYVVASAWIGNTFYSYTAIHANRRTASWDAVHGLAMRMRIPDDRIGAP